MPNPCPVKEGYYWIDIHGDCESRCIMYWREKGQAQPGTGWCSNPWGMVEFPGGAAVVVSERIVFADPKLPEAEPAAASPPAPRPPGTAAPNTAIDAIIDKLSELYLGQNMAAIAVTLVTSEDQILIEHASNPHMGSRLLAGATLMEARVLRAVEQEAARQTT